MSSTNLSDVKRASKKRRLQFSVRSVLVTLIFAPILIHVPNWANEGLQSYYPEPVLPPGVARVVFALACAAIGASFGHDQRRSGFTTRGWALVAVFLGFAAVAARWSFVFVLQGAA
ncbi:MAG: hypothetical protein N2C14_08425 [Planctomycetales bacterium]